MCRDDFRSFLMSAVFFTFNLEQSNCPLFMFIDDEIMIRNYSVKSDVSRVKKSKYH